MTIASSFVMLTLRNGMKQRRKEPYEKGFTGIMPIV
jgi:hypothetical protein